MRKQREISMSVYGGLKRAHWIFLKLDRTFLSKSDITDLNGMKTCELGPFPNLFH